MLSTKVGRLIEDDPAQRAAVTDGFAVHGSRAVFFCSRDGVRRSFATSLERLGPDRVGILFLHDVGRRTHGGRHPEVLRQALDEALPAMAELRARGGDPVAVWQAFTSCQPMGRLGAPEEIAALAVYLASDESSFTTGAIHVIDGGWSGWEWPLVKLLRYGEIGRERPALLDADLHRRDLTGVVDDIAGEVLTARGLERLRGVDIVRLPQVAVPNRVGAPLGRAGKIVCVGLNYADSVADRRGARGRGQRKLRNPAAGREVRRAGIPARGGVGLCEMVQHLAMADCVAISGRMDDRDIKYVAHLHEHFIDPARIRAGRYLPPAAPGFSSGMRAASLREFAYPDGPAWRSQRQSPTDARLKRE